MNPALHSRFLPLGQRERPNWFLVLVFWAFSVSCAGLVWAETATLTSIRSVGSPQGSTYELHIEGATVSPRHFTLDSPPRLVVDLPGTRRSAKLEATSSLPVEDHTGVLGVRLGNHPGPKVRIVFDLDALATARSARVGLLPADDGQQLVVSFLSPDGDESIQVVDGAREPRPSAVDSGPKPQAGAAVVSNSLAETSSRGQSGSAKTAITFGSATQTGASAREASSSSANGTERERSWFVDRALLETGWVRDFPGDGANSHLQFVGGIEQAVSDRLTVRLAARVDGQYQAGDLADLEYLRYDYDESWLRFATETWRLTAGAQRIIWGRADEFSPTDKLSTRDYTRLIMDDLDLRRRANPAIRIERFWGNRHLDLVFMPTFREAELPPNQSVWFPFDPITGSVAGLPLGADAQQLLLGATVDNDFDGSEGYGLRFSDTTSRFDYALTVQRVNNPEPYFTLGRLPDADRAAAIETVYPRTWLVGGDAALAAGAWTFRGEVAWLSDSPYTSLRTGQLESSEEVHWVLGAEVFPGDGNLRVTTQLSGRHLLDAEESVDFEEVISILGGIDIPFSLFGLPASADLRYSFRLDERGNYLNPELRLIAWEPSEFYLGAHIYSGAYGTQEGYYAERDTLVIGWRSKF